MDRSVESDELLARRRVGEVVGPYRLEDVLGIGGMAAVYLGRAGDGSVAAVKILHPEMSVRPDVRERFYREGYVANSIQHPGVVRVLSHGEAREAYLAMELLSGETLSDRVRRHGQLPLAELLELADQVLDVLVVAHERGIVHRDLKPDNLFVTPAGTIKILDFGLARLSEAAPSDHRTRTGIALGTLPYMAPEQALGRLSEIDGRVDLFALGATLFRILTGRRVHEGNSEAELLIAMASKPAPALASVRPDLPGDLCRVVDLALAFSRDARYPDARTMQRDVRALEAGTPPPYATARFSQREQKTRAEPMLETAPPSQLGPQGTVPIAIHRGAPLGQTYPSASAPPAAAPNAAPSPLPQAPLAAALPGGAFSATAPAGAFAITASGQSLGNPALGQTFPSAGVNPAVPGSAPQPAFVPASPRAAGGNRRALVTVVALMVGVVLTGVAAAAVWILRGSAGASPSGSVALAEPAARGTASPSPSAAAVPAVSPPGAANAAASATASGGSALAGGAAGSPRAALAASPSRDAAAVPRAPLAKPAPAAPAAAPSAAAPPPAPTAATVAAPEGQNLAAPPSAPAAAPTPSEGKGPATLPPPKSRGKRR